MKNVLFKRNSYSQQPNPISDNPIFSIPQSTNQPSLRRSQRNNSQNQAQQLEQQNKQNTASKIKTTQKKNQVAMGNCEPQAPIYKSIAKPKQKKRKRICYCKDGCQTKKCSCVKAERKCHNGCHCLRVNFGEICMNPYN